MLDDKDLRGNRSDDGQLVMFMTMTHRTEQDAVVLGQITVPEGTTEATQVRTLLGEMDIAGALVTADAVHICADAARYLVEDCRVADELHGGYGTPSSQSGYGAAALRSLRDRNHGTRYQEATTNADVTAVFNQPL
ncbi:hypothetical protein [Streptomyces sp. NPDC001401]|uniref:hypothetical protein n=1 Tax=Streptomyces sp. NPDC001401 TaxID=3364570 RepID=UPI003684FF30